MKLRLALLVLVASALGGLAATVAPAATKNGITPLSPKAGATIPVGKSPTMRARVRGRGRVWFHVCKRPKRDKFGVICGKEYVWEARRRNGVSVVKPKLYGFDAYWLNRRGTYYWQAFRIDCRGNLRDCKKEGPVVRFRVG